MAARSLNDSFAELEREYVRRTAYPSFDWLTFEAPSRRRPLALPIDRARVALVGTAGAHVRGQPRFSLGDEGDASFREIPAHAQELRLAHPGYDVRRARRDPDVVFPLNALRHLAQQGLIGELAPRAFSFMGYIPNPEPLLRDTAPEVARRLAADEVDLVLLVPV